MARRTVAQVNAIRAKAGMSLLATNKAPKPVVKTKVVIKKVPVIKEVPVVKEKIVTKVVKEIVVKRPRGRPKKQPIVANTDKAKQQLFLSEMLSGKAEQIIRKVINKALDDNDKDQMACMKMCVERVLPMSYFEKAKEHGNKGVNITIMGVGASDPIQISSNENYIDNEAEAQLIEYDDTVEETTNE